MDHPIIVPHGPKVRVVASASTWIEGEALHQMEAVSKLPGMLLCAGMPDLHPGKGGPVGAACLSEGFVHPTLVGADVGCGMAFLGCPDLRVRKACPEKLAARLDGIDAPWDGDISGCLSGLGIERTPYDEVLGTVGGGNHFIEFQAVEEIIDAEAFLALGLDADRLHLLVHSGSRRLGEAVWQAYAGQHGAAPLADGTPEAAAYLAQHDHALRWAAANRALCARRACEAAGTDMVPVLDVPHNFVAEAVIGERRGWLHRKGAAPSDMGPVAIPGSRGDLTWLVRPASGCGDALKSLAHGAGRKIARHEARDKLRGLRRHEDPRRNPWGGLVVCGDNSLLEESPHAYKPIASVVGDLFAAGLAEPIASFRPVVTFKSSEGKKETVRRGRAEWQRERRDARSAKRGRFE